MLFSFTPLIGVAFPQLNFLMGVRLPAKSSGFMPKNLACLIPI